MRTRIALLLLLGGALAAASLVGGAGGPVAATAGTAPPPESPFAAADRLRTATGGNVSVRWATATGVARFVRATNDAALPTSGTTLADRARNFLDAYGALFGVSAPGSQLSITSVRSDEAGGTVELAQRHASLPVFNAELVTHFDAAGALTAVNGTFVPGIKVPTEARVPATTATQAALGLVAQVLNVDVGALVASPPELGVHRTGLAADTPGTTALAWRTTVTGTTVREFVYVDALDGALLERFTGIHDARDRTTFNNLSQPDYSLAVKCRGEADPPSGEPDCDNAHTFAGDTYNFF